MQSELGVGSSFKVYLPRVDGPPLPEGNRINSPAERGIETVLVVEDQEDVRSLTKALLERCGYHVIAASGGEEAIAVAEQHSGQIHLLLTDVVLSGINGKELSERLRVLRPNLNVLFMSGYSADVIAHRGVLDPGVAYISKPFTPGGLATKVQEVLRQPPSTST